MRTDGICGTITAASGGTTSCGAFAVIETAERREIMQKSFMINLNDITKAKEFANICSNSGCKVSLHSDRWTVNGSSLLGIFSLDLSRPVNAIIEGTEDSINSLMQRLAKRQLCDAKYVKGEGDYAEKLHD